MTRAILLVLALLLCGCPAAVPILKALGMGAAWIASAVDVADAGQERYFQRHPMPRANQLAVQDAILATRQALAAYNGLLAAGDAANKGDVETAKQKLLDSYRYLFALLKATGVLEGVCPDGGCGGAEAGDVPEPKPLVLPLPEQVAQRMGDG